LGLYLAAFFRFCTHFQLYFGCVYPLFVGLIARFALSSLWVAFTLSGHPLDIRFRRCYSEILGRSKWYHQENAFSKQLIASSNCSQV
jgi:hypothetical protein